MTISDQVAQARVRIADIQAEREAIESQRRSRKDVAAHIDESIEHWSKEATVIAKTNMARAAAGYPAEFLTVHVRGMSVDLGPLFVLLVGPDAVRKVLAKGLTTVPEGLDTPARKQRLQECSDALHLAQVEEETLIREAEQAGEIIPHRPDADPFYALSLVSQR